MNQTVVSYLAQYEFYDSLLALFGNNQSLLAFAIYLVLALVIVGMCATIGGLGTYAERKKSGVSAYANPSQIPFLLAL